MPELRKDPVTGRWVIIATDRARRPTDFIRHTVVLKGGFCPFCPGNESKTPPEILAFRHGQGERDKPGWSVRVVPNKYPALGIEGNLDRRADGMYDRMNGIGAHEVIIETPNHYETFTTMPAKAAEANDHVLPLSELQKDVSSAAAKRAKNIEDIDRVLSLPAAQTELSKANVSPNQVNFLLPSDLTPAPVTIQVRNPAGITTAIPLTVQASAPQLFTTDGKFVLGAHSNGGSLNKGAPAAPGEAIVVYATGLGATNPPLVPGQLPTAPAPLR